MQYSPSASQLIQAVAEWLEALGSASLDGADRYHARVSVRLLRMAERELAAGARHHAPDREAVRALIGEVAQPNADAGPVGRGDTALDDERTMRAAAAAIRDGVLAAHTTDLLPTLRAYTVRRLKVVNPDYLLPQDRPSQEPVPAAPASPREA
ncbi:DUF6285 domain-containing protein [Streptomyces sp. A1499]|uniref:DUF6285 domain-containing protein n=1 Tax=Streptomyces sp. A1499 TaxID=2563104 RepID=UPI00144A767B|nr:DUF6285 domain-containing protein [Streptomyces sp. A1499]